MLWNVGFYGRRPAMCGKLFRVLQQGTEFNFTGAAVLSGKCWTIRARTNLQSVSQFTNWTIHAHLRRYSLKDISIKNWDFFAFTEQFSNKPTCGRSSHGLHNCEVTSPRFDWPRVGLLANCPVTIFAVGKLAGPQIDLSRLSLPAIIVWLPFPSTLLTPSIDQWCIGSTLQKWEFAFFCQIQFT